jgi:hypothetical protein
MSRIRFTLINTAAVAPSNEVALYAKTDRQLYLMDQDGTEIPVGAGNAEKLFETKIRFLTALEISNGYLDLTEKASPKFIQVIRDRVVFMAPDDFTVSDVGNITRLTFAGATASGGEEPFAENEKIIICYAK